VAEAGHQTKHYVKEDAAHASKLRSLAPIANVLTVEISCLCGEGYLITFARFQGVLALKSVIVKVARILWVEMKMSEPSKKECFPTEMKLVLLAKSSNLPWCTTASLNQLVSGKIQLYVGQSCVPVY
jgi:hypothetical protein